MTSYIRLNQFISAANQAYSAPVPQCLLADVSELSIHLQPLNHAAPLKEENKRTWKVFRESMVEILGQEKFDWICQRYRSHLNYSSMERSGQPLLPKHIELFSIGSNQLLGADIKKHFPGKLKMMTRAQLKERIRAIQPFPIVGNYKDPITISGSPGTLAAHFVHDKLLMDKEKQCLFSDVEHLSFPAWMERFAKVIVNRELIKGQLIPAPGQDGRIDYYTVYEKIATGDGLISYALKPTASDSILKPILFFRGSQWALANEDAIETYLNDVQHRVGEMGWVPAKTRFEQLMQDSHFRRNNEMICMAGYSLGGLHAQLCLNAFHESVSHAVFYNDPSVDSVTAERFAANVNQMPRRTEPLNIQIFRTQEDFCHYVGEKHVGWGVNHPDVNIQLLEIDPERKKVAGFQLHSHRIFDNSTFPYQMQRYEDVQELFNRLDNSKRGPEVVWYERTRMLSSRVAFIVFSAFAELVKFFSYLLGVKILRSSKDPN